MHLSGGIFSRVPKIVLKPAGKRQQTRCSNITGQFPYKHQEERPPRVHTHQPHGNGYQIAHKGQPREQRRPRTVLRHPVAHPFQLLPLYPEILLKPLPLAQPAHQIADHPPRGVAQGSHKCNNPLPVSHQQRTCQQRLGSERHHRGGQHAAKKQPKKSQLLKHTPNNACPAVLFYPHHTLWLDTSFYSIAT